MREIINRLNEMAISKSEAMDKCLSLGKQFIEHYHKVYLEGPDSRDFQHHCHEMQTWYNSVRSIKLKNTNRGLTPVNLIDWFFTVGAIPEDFLDTDDEIDSYNKFIIELLHDSDSKISDIIL